MTFYEVWSLPKRCVFVVRNIMNGVNFDDFLLN